MRAAAVREVAMIVVTVNGEARRVAAGTTVSALLRTLALDPRTVVVEHNRAILRDGSAHDRVGLVEGDVLEVVHFVGGG